MRNTFYSKLYSYTERKNKGSKENFLIEIFAHCLATDNKLCTDFLAQIGIKRDGLVIVSTQTIYSFGRPDIEIKLPEMDTIILIECKVEHFERENQLNDYACILKERNEKNKHLIYLTKYHEIKKISEKSVKFHWMKWNGVHDLIDDANKCQFTKELKKYLMEEKMASQNNFNESDLSTMLNLANIVGKMDEVIDAAGNYYESKMGVLAKSSTRYTQLKDNTYSSYQSVNKLKSKIKYEICLGFFPDDVENVNYIGIYINVYTNAKYSNSMKLAKLLQRKLNAEEWDYEDEDEKVFVFNYLRNINEFMLPDVDQMPLFYKFFQKGIDELYKIKKANSKLF